MINKILKYTLYIGVLLLFTSCCNEDPDAKRPLYFVIGDVIGFIVVSILIFTPFIKKTREFIYENNLFSDMGEDWLATMSCEIGNEDIGDIVVRGMALLLGTAVWVCFMALVWGIIILIWPVIIFILLYIVIYYHILRNKNN